MAVAGFGDVETAANQLAKPSTGAAPPPHKDTQGGVRVANTLRDAEKKCGATAVRHVATTTPTNVDMQGSASSAAADAAAMKRGAAASGAAETLVDDTCSQEEQKTEEEEGGMTGDYIAPPIDLEACSKLFCKKNCLGAEFFWMVLGDTATSSFRESLARRLLAPTQCAPSTYQRVARPPTPRSHIMRTIDQSLL